MLHIRPAADARDNLLPIVHIGEDSFAATLVELRDAVFFDVFLVLEAELFLNDIFYRQAVAIPAPDARHMVAAHREIARHGIL